MKIYHNTRKLEYREPFGAAEISSTVKLAIDAPGASKAQVRIWQDELGETIQSMEDVGGKFVTELEMPSEGTLLWYYFIISNEDGSLVYYGNNEANTGGEGAIYDGEPPSFQITVYRHEPVPSWFKAGTVYQIFPDRFARDDNWHDRLQQAGRNIEEDWYKPASYDKDERGHVKTWSFYGGSLKGIEGKLDYLKSMGVSVIYLNPIFKATSNHRYDTADYMTIDPALGSEDDFVELCHEARKRNIRIILDGVFSHVGADSIYFDKYGNYGGTGAFGNPESKYRSWFEFRENDPVGYRAWWGVDDLPEVNEDEESFRDLICGENGVIAKWLRLGASGFRLDVADELPDSFIQEIRRRIKAEGEDNLLMGEVWEDASNKISYGDRRKYFMGDELDSTMHYPLRDAIMSFALHDKSGAQVADEIMSLAENYPYENFYGAMNLIGSHDRKRILSAMGVDDNYDMAADRVKMLAALQFTLPGVPCIYYGDEAGMIGGEDPENRSAFIWERENPALQSYYRMLGLVYKEHDALKSGALEFIDTDDDDILAFAREDDKERIIVIANRGDQKNLDVSGYGLKDYSLELLQSRELSGETNIEMAARSAKIIYTAANEPSSFDMGRKAGVICHISSIPGRKLGAPARSFVDYIASAGMSLWQILPLNPPGWGDSPYSSFGAFAGNPDFINIDELPRMDGLDEFIDENDYWLEAFSSYVADKKVGNQYDEEIKKQVKVEQYIFAYQWRELREYANSKGVEILGDLPVFVSPDSADVWADRKPFRIDENGRLSVHAGVPPDYFSEDGQDWGNPLYDWDKMAEDEFTWWARRLKQASERYDYVRLDHFRSFSEYYAIPEGEKPTKGMWQQGPGLKFFEKMNELIGDDLKILAEDLGQLDAGVSNLIKLTGLPGMNVWQFSADEMMEMTAEEAVSRVFYSGTHDNQTLVSWCEDSGLKKSDALSIIKALYESPAPWVIIQMQDMLMLDDSARMNVPGTPEGNWSWHLNGNSVEDGIPKADRIAAGFKSLAHDSGRLDDFQLSAFLKRHKLEFGKRELSGLTEEMANFYADEISTGNIKGVTYVQNKMERDVVAIDLGGTNTRVGLVHIDQHGAAVGRLARMKTPGRTSEVSIDEMFDSLVKLVKQVDRDDIHNGVGIGFSFPGTPVDGSRPDLRIDRWDKELKVNGGEGRIASNLMKDAMTRGWLTQKPVAVANDTVTTFMAGSLMADNDKPCIAGLVLGTGINICLLNKDRNEIFNLESGDYGKLPSGDIDEIIDRKSSNPGIQRAEKMMSGAYRNELINLTASFGIKEGLISPEMDSVDDKIRMKAMEEAVVGRAAEYTAVMVAAAVKLTGFRDGVYSIMAEGSVFWKVEGFCETVKKLSNQLLLDEGVEIEFINKTNAGLIGAAALI